MTQLMEKSRTLDLAVIWFCGSKQGSTEHVQGHQITTRANGGISLRWKCNGHLMPLDKLALTATYNGEGPWKRDSKDYYTVCCTRLTDNPQFKALCTYS